MFERRNVQLLALTQLPSLQESNGGRSQYVEKGFN